MSCCNNTAASQRSYTSSQGPWASVRLQYTLQSLKGDMKQSSSVREQLWWCWLVRCGLNLAGLSGRGRWLHFRDKGVWSLSAPNEQARYCSRRRKKRGTSLTLCWCLCWMFLKLLSTCLRCQTNPRLQRTCLNHLVQISFHQTGLEVVVLCSPLSLAVS